MSAVKKSFAIAATAATVVMGAAGVAAADAGAHGVAAGSPGVLSGNLIQVPLRQHRQRHRPAQPGLRQHLRQRLT